MTRDAAETAKSGSYAARGRPQTTCYSIRAAAAVTSGSQIVEHEDDEMMRPCRIQRYSLSSLSVLRGLMGPLDGTAARHHKALASRVDLPGLWLVSPVSSYRVTAVSAFT